MKLDPLLTKAVRLLRRKKYPAVIQALESEVVRYHDSFRYHYILALSCLRAGDFGGAFTYFKRARDIKMRSPQALLGLAALFLRRGETSRALDLYLEVQDLDKGNRIARRALQVIRKNSADDRLSLWIEGGNLPSLYPPLPPLPLTWDRIVLPVLAAAILAAVVFIRVTGTTLFPPSSARPVPEAGVLSREDRDEPVETGGSYRYILTRAEALDTYGKAQALFADKRDEAARKDMNRLLESNAAEGIKTKARLLLSLMETPGFDSLKDPFSYHEVISDPVLYRDCHVIWRGMAANITEGEDFTDFEFLVGYDTSSVLQGIVGVHFPFAVAVNHERPLEVLGRVLPVVSPGGIEDIRLEGLAIHQGR